MFTDERGEVAVSDGGWELYVDVLRSVVEFLHSDATLVNHLKLFQWLRSLRISYVFYGIYIFNLNVRKRKTSKI